jgi:hypothetical protein
MLTLDANGDFILEGLEPGDYRVSIRERSSRLSETKVVTLKKNEQASVSFFLEFFNLIKIER